MNSRLTPALGSHQAIAREARQLSKDARQDGIKFTHAGAALA
jgi:hypothetical protein